MQGTVKSARSAHVGAHDPGGTFKGPDGASVGAQQPHCDAAFFVKLAHEDPCCLDRVQADGLNKPHWPCELWCQLTISMSMGREGVDQKSALRGPAMHCRHSCPRSSCERRTLFECRWRARHNVHRPEHTGAMLRTPEGGRDMTYVVSKQGGTTKIITAWTRASSYMCAGV